MFQDLRLSSQVVFLEQLFKDISLCICTRLRKCPVPSLKVLPLAQTTAASTRIGCTRTVAASRRSSHSVNPGSSVKNKIENESKTTIKTDQTKKSNLINTKIGMRCLLPAAQSPGLKFRV